MKNIQAHRVGHLPRNPEPDKRGPKPKLIPGPDLPNAACKGLSPLFDDTVHGETDTQRHQRHHKALNICQTKCPIQTQCLTTRETTPDLGTGIYGGRLFENTPEQRRLDREAEQTPHTRTCKNCHKPFQTITRRAYCGNTCVHDAHAQHTANTDRCRKKGSEQRRHTKPAREAA